MVNIYIHDSLPYYDGNLSKKEKTEIDMLIAEEVPVDQPLHPLVCKYTEWNPSSMLIKSELERIENGYKLDVIDLSRYTSFKEPVTSDKKLWIHAINKSLVASEFLKGRIENLRLLEEFGKNSWLLHIEQLEHYLQQLETHLLDLQDEISILNKERKKFQTGDMGLQLQRLENEFRHSIRRIFDVEVANFLLEREIHNFQNKT
ncbi:hypothetical protein T552_03108 [Pneumocystis carinii B80]|uniref:Uncharacterized protein n=1 Tax=Pneumocystis carinii (strain B80) TaxID=1408658 RepID=A0A0W4ZBV5_PNEC8|nr:hypothetical protein T552_03108 [Pneumocystis carinii B80]KTW25836.1 hypothetical protein T552_03108 [Pneumocystis carinii B80]